MKKIISIVTLSLILLCGFIFTGCGDTSGPLSISLDVAKIEMLATSEPKTYTITVKNHTAKVEFDFGFENNFASILNGEVKDIGEGKYTFSVAPISPGNTTLKITLRGTTKSVSVPVEISEPLQSFACTKDVFVVKGSSITLTNSLFTFTPTDTTLKNLSFKIKEDQDIVGDIEWDEQTNTLTVGQTTNSYITFIATSKDDISKTCEFDVKIFSPVELSSLTIYSIGQDTQNKEEFDSVNARDVVYNYESEENIIQKDIELITNIDTSFRKLISVEFNFGGEYKIDVYSTEGILGDISKDSPKLNNSNNFEFIIQSNDVNPAGEPYTLTFKIYQADFADNCKFVTINVYAVSVPNEIRINSKNVADVVNLYHNNQTATDFRFSVFPSLEGKQNEENYTYSIGFYNSNNGIDIGEKLSYDKLSEHLTVTYGGIPFYNLINDNAGYAIVSQLKNLSSILSVKPIKEYEGHIVAVVECYDKQDTKSPICSNNIFIKIYKGTFDFLLDSKYKNNTIYIPMPSESDLNNPKGTKTFAGFIYDYGSTIGELNITTGDITDICCSVEQVQSDIEVALSITPLKVGTSQFRLETQNGRSIDLNIVVFREIEESNFAIDFNSNYQSNISSFNYKENLMPDIYNHNTLDNVVFKGTNATAYIKDMIYGYDDANNYSYDYSLEIDTGINTLAKEYFEIVDNSTIVSKKFTTQKIGVKVALTLYKWEAFQRVVNEAPQNQSFYFTLECIDYIKSANIMVGESDSKTKVKTVYDINTLSYINQNLAEVYVYLDLETCGKLNKHLNDPNVKYVWEMYSGKTPISYNKNTGKVGSIGYFYPTQYDDEGKAKNGEDYVGKFVCDISGISSIKQFTITLRLIDKTFDDDALTLKKGFETTITVDIGRYIDVSSLYLTNATDSIYLDATENNKTTTVGYYVLPNDAMCKEIQIVIDSSTPNCIAYYINGNVITFTYVSGGSGTIRIFPVSKMKTSNTKDEYGNYYYHISIDFNCADGTNAERALKLSSYEDLINLNPNLHYFIESVINCGGKELYIPTFSGSIRGIASPIPNKALLEDTGNADKNKENLEKYNSQVEKFNANYQSGEIINFVVKYKGSNSGLFGSLRGSITNLKIEGYFETKVWNIEQNSNIGLVCGTNNGTITDVLVLLQNKTDKDGKHLVVANVAESEINTNVGLVAGINNGKIEVTNNNKVSTMFVNLQESFNASFRNNQIIEKEVTTTYNLNSYCGGVVGVNSDNGIIINSHTDNQNLTIGLYGISANVNMHTDATYMGAVCGSTSGEIHNLKVVGRIINTKVGSYTAGLTGAYTREEGVINGNTSRVFVKSSGAVAGLIANIGEVLNFDNINNNKVQATDSGKIGLDATLLVKKNTGEIYPIAPVELNNTNIAESYVDRSISLTFIQYLPVENYYGDLVVTNNAENLITSYNEFNKGTSQHLSANVGKFVLAIFKQATDAEKQQNINNTLSVLTLVKKIANVNGDEFNMTVDKSALATIINFGKELNINSTGTITITLTSTLNYKESLDILVHITNYFEEFKTFEDKNHTTQNSTFNLVNTQSKTVYLSCYSPAINYKNTPIELKSNTEVLFSAKERGTNNLNITSVEQKISISSKQEVQTLAYVDIYPMLSIDGVVYYATKNADLNAFVFLPNSLGDSKTEVCVTVETGIENIEISKAEVLAEPSNEIEFEVIYDTYNSEDVITFELSADQNTYYQISWDDESRISGSFFDNFGNKLFTLIKNNTQNLGPNTVKESYILKMELSKNNYLNYKNSEIIVVAKSVLTNQKDSFIITYNPETITAVIITNYNYEDNEGMIDERKYDLAYYEQHMLVASSYSSTGEFNLIKGYVFTRLGEFDYLEVSMNAGAEGGYLALGEEVELEVGEEKITKGVANKNVVYTSIDGTVTMLAAKSDIISDDELFGTLERMLEFTIIYSLPNTIADETRVPITLTFYKKTNQGLQVCYTPETMFVVARAASRVEIELIDKEQEIITKEELDQKTVQSYSVVKGKTYPLNLDVFGYREDEIVIESSSPNVANVQKIDNNYYLTIYATNTDYNDKPYLLVYIYSYGQKLSNNDYKKGKVQVTALRIFEFLLNTEEVFASEKLSLRTLTTVDIRDSILDLLNLETAVNNSNVVKFKNSFKENSIFKLLTNEIIISLPTTNIVSTSLYKLDGCNFQPLKIINVAPYQFSVEYEFTYKNGMPTCTIGDEDVKYYGVARFEVEVYINTTEELPAPIDTYEDLISVKDDEHYILTSDITIPGAEFNMITTTPKSLDGNGYKIIIKGENFGANLQNISNFALFENINAGSVFKNIDIVIDGGKKISIDNNYYNSGVNVGILAANNNGIITNCSVTCNSTITVNVLATVAIMENSYFGTICAINSGYITNCRVTSNITVSGVSVGGLVCNNEGQIVSSYIKNSRIANEVGSSNENITTGGLVCLNTGKISMSFVEGRQSENKIYADYPTNNEKSANSKIIYTSSEVGGFAYKNSGEITDCYANIPIVSSNRCAGFVAINSNSITRCFSLSKMKQNDTLNYAFVITTTEKSIFTDCYFVLEKDRINEYTSITNYTTALNDKGKEIYVGVIPGLEPLGIKDFSITNENGTIKENTPFKNYLIGNGVGDSAGIWFYVFDQTKNASLVSPLQSYLAEAEQFKVYDINSKEYTAQQFNAGVLQLSSANLITTSRKVLNVNKDETYFYSVEDSVVAQGSRDNPHLIATAKELEDLCNQKAKSLQYFRLISDINYETEGVYTSNLCSSELFANFEGNNFNISNYAVNSKTSYLSSGLFAKFGKENSDISTLKNVTFNPSYINLPNSTFVGGIAGTAVSANIYNVNINGANVVISGRNFVGGLFGRTLGRVNVKSVYSNVVAKASQFGAELIGGKDNVESVITKFSYGEVSSKRASSSYAGAIIGYVGGSSLINDARVGEDAKVFGVMAGLLFGGINNFSGVSNLNLELNSYSNTITAYGFGGIVAGENKGLINNVNINSDIVNKKLFTAYPITPISIGGIAGLVSGGTISNINSSKGYAVIGADFTNGYQQTNLPYIVSQVNNPYVVKYVGGVVGYGKQANVQNINIFGLTENKDGTGSYNIDNNGKIVKVASNGNYNKNEDLGILIMGANNVGGILGYAKEPTIQNVAINIISHKEYVNAEGVEVDEAFYMSYVSEVSSYLINNFTKENNVGAVAGMVDTSLTMSGQLIEITDIYTYYALYDAPTEIENTDDYSALSYLYFVGNKVGSSLVIQEEVNRTYLSLITGTALYTEKDV